MNFDEMKNARVAILGMGREGQAVWRQLRQRFPAKTLTLFAESEIDDSFRQKLKPAIDHFHIGRLDIDHLKTFDILVRSAGISPYRPELTALRKSGQRFTSASNLWFAENPEAKTICISGTKGKSTTAALTNHLINKAGLKSCLAGNIGKPMLEIDDQDIDWWVIELSSYQISDLEARPSIVLLLNLSDEHVDWHGSAERYASDKLKLAELARGGQVIANYADKVLVEKLAQINDVKWFNKDKTCRAYRNSVAWHQNTRLPAPKALPGEHNMQNLVAALSVIDELGLEIEDLSRALSTFNSLPHRLQFIGEKERVRYIDDSISTTPVSVAAALQAVGNDNVVLLLGGMDRGLGWAVFADNLKGQVPHAIITMPDNGSKIFNCLKGAGVKPPGGIHQSTQLREAVAIAQQLVPERGCILLSPGAPSFPHFRDFEDRGNQFRFFAGIENGPSSAH